MFLERQQIFHTLSITEAVTYVVSNAKYSSRLYQTLRNKAVAIDA